MTDRSIVVLGRLIGAPGPCAMLRSAITGQIAVAAPKTFPPGSTWSTGLPPLSVLGDGAGVLITWTTRRWFLPTDPDRRHCARRRMLFTAAEQHSHPATHGHPAPQSAAWQARVAAEGGTLPLFPLFGEPGEPDQLLERAAVAELEPAPAEPVPDAPVLIGPLIVDAVWHAAEIARFYNKVVVGPVEHCHIWTGAISDDGYGTFSITRAGVERTVKAHRFAVAHRLGVAVAYGQVVEHVLACARPVSNQRI